MALKRGPFGSPGEEFFIPKRKFVSGRNWGGNAVQKNLKFYYQFIQYIKTTVQRGWLRLECLQNASTSCFIIIVWASSFSPLLCHTRSRGRCWAANPLSYHPKPLGRAIHGEDGLDIGRKHGQRFDFLRHTQVAEVAILHLCKQEQKLPSPVQRHLISPERSTYVIVR